MPGLPPVVQPFSIDDSGYGAGLGRMAAGNAGLAQSIDQNVLAKIGEVEAAAGRMANLPEMVVRVRYETAGIPAEARDQVQVIRQVIETSGGQDIARQFREQMASVRSEMDAAVQAFSGQGGMIAAYGTRLADAQVTMAAFAASTAEVTRQVSAQQSVIRLSDRTLNAAQAAMDTFGARVASTTVQIGVQTDAIQMHGAALDAAQNGIDRFSVAQEQAGAAVEGASRKLKNFAIDAAAVNAAVERMMPSASSTSQSLLSSVIEGAVWRAQDNNAAAAIADAAAANRGGGGAGPLASYMADIGVQRADASIWAPRSAAVTAQIARNVASSGYGPTPGSNDPVDLALAALTGGGGGGGGGGPVAGGGGADSFGLGAAAVQSDKFLSWIRTWYPRFHYVMMGINEALATIGPATVAAGAAGFVGLQGGQTAVDRIKAINAVGQSLGAGALNETPGQALGLGDSLQKAQNVADTGVWELMGAGINSVKDATDSASGGLGNFWQMGTNVIAMLDRFSAGLTNDFQGGAGKQLQALVSGGTQDLQDFGQVAGNIGKTFLNVAPNLPGVGGDILSTLDFATKGLSDTTGFLGNIGLLGPTLAFEAASRYGPALVGSAGRGIGVLGTGIESGLGAIGTGLGAVGAGGAGAAVTSAGTSARTALGSVAHAASAEEAATLGVAEGDAVGGAGVAGLLGSLSAPIIGLLGAAAFGVGKLVTEKTPAQAFTDNLMSNVNQSTFGAGYGSLITGMNQSTSLEAQGYTQLGLPFGSPVNPVIANRSPNGLDYAQSMKAIGDIQSGSGATAQMSKQFMDLLAAGGQIQKQFGGDLPDAYGLADQALLQLGSSFENNGKLTKTATTEIQNAITGYTAMHQNVGQYGQSVAAVNAALGLQGSQLSTVNSAWDQFTSNAAGGTSTATGFAQSLAAAQTLGASLTVPKVPAVTATQKATATHTAEEAAVSSRKDQSNLAKALMSFTSTQGVSAWAALSSTSTTSPGLVQQAGSTLDWLRTAATSYNQYGKPGISAQQLGGAGAYLAKQLLPYGKDSPAALSEIATLGQQAGLPTTYNQGQSLAENYKNISAQIDKAASSTKAYNSTLTVGTEALSNASAQAQGFGAAVGSDVVDAAASGAANLPKLSADMGKFTGSLQRGAAAYSPGDLKSVVSDLQDTGASLSTIQSLVSQAATMHGTAGMTAIMKQVQSDMGANTAAAVKSAGESGALLHPGGKMPVLSRLQQQDLQMKVTADTSGISKVKSDIAGISGKDIKLAVTADTSGADRAKNAVQSVADKTVRLLIQANTAGAIAAKAALNAVQNKTVTINLRYVTSGAGGAMPGASGPLAGHVLAEQTGGRIPGYGGGDIVPAMLEPGEAVVPKHLVGMVAPLLAGRVPGFAAGGIAPGASAMMQAMSGASSAGQIAEALGSAPMETAASMISSQMSYLAGTYGNPGNAVAHKLQYGWFDAGGMLMPGMTLAYNGTGAPERITPMSAGGGPAGGPGAGQYPVTQAPLSAALQQLEAQLAAQLTASGFGKKIAVQIVDGLTSGLADSEGAKGVASIASNLVKKISTEIAYAKSTSASIVSGLNFSQLNPASGGIADQMQGYLTSVQQFTTAITSLSKDGLNTTLLKQLISAGPAALPEAQAILGQGAGSAASASAVSGLNFAQMDPTQGPVAQQMGTYTSSLKQFTKDIGSLSKDHLNKQLLNQLIQAGPSSDPLAQSLLGAGGTGGNQVAAVNAAYASLNKAANQFGAKANQAQGGGKGEVEAINKLYGAISKAANVFGAKAAGAAYGGVLAPNLKSGTFTTNNVTINVSMGGGASGNMALSNAQMKQLVSEIEAKLLQQSKRNRKTGLTQKGYGS